MIRRREFITLLGGAAAAWPLVARAQQAERVRRDRCAHAHELGRARIADPHRGILARIAGGGLDRRPQSTDRLPLERKRPRPLEPTRGRTGFARPRCHPGWHRRDHAVAAARQPHRTNRVCADIDPVGSGVVESLARPGGNGTGFTQFEYTLQREMARVAAGNRAGLARAQSFGMRPGLCRDWSMGGHPGRGRPARRGADAHRPARHPRDRSAPSRLLRKSATAA